MLQTRVTKNQEVNWTYHVARLTQDARLQCNAIQTIWHCTVMLQCIATKFVKINTERKKNVFPVHY